jgi:hypothetical protein
MITKSNKNDIYAPTIGNALAVYIELLSGKLRLQDQRGEDVNLAEFFDTKNMSIVGLSELASGDAEETDIILVRNSNEWKKMTVQDAQSLFGSGGQTSPLSPALMPSKDIIYSGTSLGRLHMINAQLYSGVETITCPNLVSIVNNSSGLSNTIGVISGFKELNLPLLESVTGAFSISGQQIDTIDLIQLETVNTLTITDTIITTLALPSLQDVGDFISVTFNPQLALISLPPNFFNAETYYGFDSNALTEETVDNILSAAVNSEITDKELYLNGGTNSAPSVSGATNVAILTSRGWSVSTN